MRCNGAERREDRVADDRIKQEPAASEDIGERRDQQRGQVAEANRGEHVAEVRLGDSESVLNLLEGEAQQRAIIVVEEAGGGRNAEDAPLALRKGRNLAQQEGRK